MRILNSVPGSIDLTLRSESIVDRIVARSEFIYESDSLLAKPDDYLNIDENVVLSECAQLRAWRSAFEDFSWQDFLTRVASVKKTSLAIHDQQQFRRNAVKLIDYFSVPGASLSRIATEFDLARKIRALLTKYFLSIYFLSDQPIYSKQEADLITDFDRIFSRWFLPTVNEYCEDVIESKCLSSSELLIRLFEQYPVFTRLLVTKGHNWVKERCCFLPALRKTRFLGTIFITYDIQLKSTQYLVVFQILIMGINPYAS